MSNSPQINSNIKINNASINSKTINKNDIFFAIKEIIKMEIYMLTKLSKMVHH